MHRDISGCGERWQQQQQQQRHPRGAGLQAAGPLCSVSRECLHGQQLQPGAGHGAQGLPGKRNTDTTCRRSNALHAVDCADTLTACKLYSIM